MPTARPLGDSNDVLFDFLGGHHQIRQFVDDEDDVGQLRDLGFLEFVPGWKISFFSSRMLL